MGLRKRSNLCLQNANGCGGDPCWNAAIVVTFLICLKILPSPPFKYISVLLVFSHRRCFVSLIFCFEISPPQALIRDKNQCKRVFGFRGARLGRGLTHHVPNHCAAKQLQYVWLLPLIPHQALFAHKLFGDLAFTNPPCLPDNRSFRRSPVGWDVVFPTTSRALGRANVFNLHGYYR